MRNILVILFLLAGTISFAQEKEPELTWPREIKEKNYTITLYQSQLESFEGNILKGRMALSIKNEKEDIIFGALWFKARLATDLETRTAILEAFEIPKVKFPDVEDQSKLEKLKKIIIDDLESINIEMSLDRIISDIESITQGNELGEKLKNDPPVIFFRSTPTVLIIIDGDPILEKVENSKLETVVNTPFLILKDKKNYYIHGESYWYKADKITSENWKVTKSVPKDVEKAGEKMVDKQEPPEVTEENSEIPDIIVTTKPSELIISDGELKYEPINETSLLFVSNSENDILLDINLQTHFVLINGRWYNSKTLKDGEWKFIEPDKLPEDFAAIPSEATIASVKASVPGTPEAQESLYEQQMPQTAVVDRKTAKTEVKYDGKPKFEKMEGTSVQYAANTESTVIKVDKTYYCVDEGIWFESSKPDGPWKVSDKRPEEVDEIPPSAPVYNVKYVYIYDSTPEVVYVGYTPGYCYSYPYSGVVVYGTGYYYRPWYGAHYYPRPVTYGFGVHYNPYTGWGFSVGVSYGWFSMSMYRHHSYWGPAGYRHGYRHGYHHGYHRGYHNGYKAGYAHGRYHSRNIYNNRPTGVRPPANSRNRPSTQPVNNKGTRPSQKPNNVYTDKKGNVYSRDKSGNWKQENKRPATSPSQRPSTQPSTRPSQRPSTQPSTKPAQRPSTQPSTRPSTGASNQLQRDAQNRSRGNSNYNSYQQSRPAPSNRSYQSRPQSRPQQRSSGGGGRRR